MSSDARREPAPGTATGPRLVLVHSGRSASAGKSDVRLDRPLTIIGSKPHAHLRLASNRVSGAHALLVTDGSRALVRDLMSRARIRVNGQEVHEAWLRHGDKLRVGPFKFVSSRAMRPSGTPAARERITPPRRSLIRPPQRRTRRNHSNSWPAGDRRRSPSAGGCS